MKGGRAEGEGGRVDDKGEGGGRREREGGTVGEEREGRG